MGLDLRLLPFDGGDFTTAFSHTILNVDQLPDVFEKIRQLPKRPVDVRFTSYLGDAGGYGETTEDCYGELLCYVLAGELSRIVDQWIDKNPTTRATWAYLNALPWNTKVVLYWH